MHVLHDKYYICMISVHIYSNCNTSILQSLNNLPTIRPCLSNILDFYLNILRKALVTMPLKQYFCAASLTYNEATLYVCMA